MKTLTILAILTIASLPASAALVGTQCNGSLTMPNDLPGVNFFDPANGLVPPGSNPNQPYATVVDPDGSYIEFQMYENSVQMGMDVDVDDVTMTFTWYCDYVAAWWNVTRVTISELEIPISGVTVIEAPADVVVTFGETWVQVDTPEDMYTALGSPVVVVVEIESPVATEKSTWSNIKAQFR